MTERTESYVVICRDDTVITPTGYNEPGPYILATRRVFGNRVLAEAYARTVAAGRQAIVVSGHWNELRTPT